eukprot:2071361-Amphidinium_carterae.4
MPPQPPQHGSLTLHLAQCSRRMQKPSQSSWQMNSGTQQWNSQSQSQSSNWQGSSYQSSNAQQPYWSSSQYTYGGQYKQNPQQGRSNSEALRDGTFPKANFTPGKVRRMKPRARQEDECPDP